LENFHIIGSVLIENGYQVGLQKAICASFALSKLNFMLLGSWLGSINGMDLSLLALAEM
jgi:hypothetical protein